MIPKKLSFHAFCKAKPAFIRKTGFVLKHVQNELLYSGSECIPDVGKDLVFADFFAQIDEILLGIGD